MKGKSRTRTVAITTGSESCCVQHNLEVVGSNPTPGIFAPMMFAVAVGAKNLTFGRLSQNAVFAPIFPPQSCVDSDFLLLRVFVVKLQTGGMVFTTVGTMESGFKFGKPNLN